MACCCITCSAINWERQSMRRPRTTGAGTESTRGSSRPRGRRRAAAAGAALLLPLVPDIHPHFLFVHAQLLPPAFGIGLRFSVSRGGLQHRQRGNLVVGNGGGGGRAG